MTENIRNLAERYSKSILILYQQEGLIGTHGIAKGVRAARHLSLSIRLSQSQYRDKAINLSNKIAMEARCASVLGLVLKNSPGFVTYQFQLPGGIHQGQVYGLWESYTGKDVRGLGVGLADNRQQIDYEFFPPHSGVFGTTGSGKTEAVRRILVTLCKNYTPQELNLIICDPKQDFTECFENEDHLLLPVAVTMEEIEIAILTAGGILADRRIKNIRNEVRIVLAADEVSTILEYFGETSDVVKAMQAIARDGRTFKVNLLISDQTPTGGAFPKLIRLVNNRFVGLVDKPQTSALLTGRPQLHCHRLTGFGDFMHISDNREERFQVALVEPKEFEKLSRGNGVPKPQIATIEQVVNIADDYKRSPGRPEIEYNPNALAEYLGDPDAITMLMAEEELGLRRKGHEKHRDFAKAIYSALERIGLMPTSPRIVANYLVRRDLDVAVAKSEFDLSPLIHDAYQNFAAETTKEILKLILMRNGNGHV